MWNMLKQTAMLKRVNRRRYIPEVEIKFYAQRSFRSNAPNTPIQVALQYSKSNDRFI